MPGRRTRVSDGDRLFTIMGLVCLVVAGVILAVTR